MKKMQEMILAEGKVLPGGILKVGSFLSQKIDTAFLAEMAEEILEAILSSEEEEGAAEVAEVGNGTSGTVLLCSTGVEQKGPSPCSAAVVTVAPGENAEEEKKEILPDEDPVSLQILERLDRLIALLAPAECAAGDEEGEAAADPVEEVMEAVEEVLEAEAAAGEAPEVIAAAGA